MTNKLMKEECNDSNQEQTSYKHGEIHLTVVRIISEKQQLLLVEMGKWLVVDFSRECSLMQGLYTKQWNFLKRPKAEHIIPIRFSTYRHLKGMILTILKKCANYMYCSTLHI